MKEKLILGIDDAGRGPVIGPMVLAGTLLDKKTSEELKKLKITDSKLIRPKQRKKFAKIIREKAIAYEIIQSTAKEIDETLNNKSKLINLNFLEAIKSAMIINLITQKHKNIKVIIDCPSINITAWQQTLLTLVNNKNTEIICQHKADLNHVQVSAASILAKTTRDAEIKKIKQQINHNIGSGYPSDPKTKEFLKTHGKEFKNSGIIRTTWNTWKNIEKKEKQSKLL